MTNLVHFFGIRPPPTLAPSNITNQTFKIYTGLKGSGDVVPSRSLAE